MGASLKGKRVLVTGASSGIGWETALVFANRGAKVALLARRADKLAQLAGIIKMAGVETLELPCDVTDPAQVASSVEAVEKAWGGIDVLVNNAGVNEYARFLDLPADKADEILRINVNGPIHVLRAVLPGMVRRGEGHVVNVASIAGLRGMPFMAVYSASKFALVGLTESLRIELAGKGVTLTAFCPGSVETPMMEKAQVDPKMRRMVRPRSARGTAEKIARAAECRSVEVVYGEAPGFVIKVLRSFPWLADRLILAAYRRLGSLLPAGMRL